MFDLNADWAAIVQSLRTDCLLAAPVGSGPGLRVPGCWNGFELATRAILGQQITVKGATLLAGRMASYFGRPFASGDDLTRLFPTPEVLADAELARIGLTRARVETIRTLAREVCDGRISFDRVVDSEALLNRLREIPGIGQWTAQYIAMRALGEPDAFPSGDLGLMRAVAVDREAAEMLGINVNFVIAATFFLGSALAGVAGVMGGLLFNTVYPTIGFIAGLKAFTASVVGGIGSIPGAMLGGLLIGVAESFITGYISSTYTNLLVFALLIAVMLIRPSGLLGQAQLQKV